MRSPTQDAWTIREALRGNIDFAALPLELVRQIKTIQRRMQRQYDQAVRNEAHSARNIAAGLNGPRAVVRRLRQIEAGRLTVANGVAACQEAGT